MSAERARLFVALDLPAKVREELVSWRATLGDARELRLIATEYLHATLCFLGWQAAEEIEPIAQVCREIAADSAAIRLGLSDAVWLPSRRPRVLAVILADPDGGLAGLQASLSERLQAGGWYVPEKRSFLAHVTLARVPTGARARSRPVSSRPELDFVGGELTLYRSHLDRAGARYEPQARISLAPV